MNPPVTWIPAHPSSGSISMLRYWRFLERATEDGDRYRCEPIIPDPGGEIPQRGSVIKRQFDRRIAYPWKIRSSKVAGLAHLLDHSWADLLPHLPKQCLKVATVHDLIPLRFPGELSAASRKRFESWVSFLALADQVIAVSDYTKREVVELLSIPTERISVVPNGVQMPPPRVPETRVREAIAKADDGFRIGCVGSILKRKNLECLPAALRTLHEISDSKPVLVRAGKPVGESLRSDLLEVLGPSGFVELGWVTDDELEDFYRSVDVVVVPSLYEGFGLPVLEAMARGVPVVAANSSSLPEVGGEAARYFDPKRPEDLGLQLKEIMNRDIAESLIRMGRERVRTFTWRRTLEGVYSVYDEVLAR